MLRSMFGNLLRVNIFLHGVGLSYFLVFGKLYLKNKLKSRTKTIILLQRDQVSGGLGLKLNKRVRSTTVLQYSYYWLLLILSLYKMVLLFALVLMKNTVFGHLELFDVFVIDISINRYTLSTLWPQPPQYVKSISIFLRDGNKLM